jgi:hypothetical protein
MITTTEHTVLGTQLGDLTVVRHKGDEVARQLGEYLAGDRTRFDRSSGVVPHKVR